MIATQTMVPFARRPVGDTPVMVLAGEKDFLFSVPELRKTAEKYKAKFVEFPGQAHNLMLEPAWQQVAIRLIAGSPKKWRCLKRERG